MTIASSRHFSKLVQDYVGNADSPLVRTFFACSPFAEGAAIEEIIRKRIDEHRSPERAGMRTAVIESITATHTRSGLVSSQAARHLEMFADDNCLAIVTGQQVGILGGPLYTFYKALHAVILAKQYAARYPQYQFVPVFWQETEDHDVAEVSWSGIIDSNFDFKRVVYTPAELPDRTQAASLSLEETAIGNFFADIRSSLSNSDFTSEVLGMFERCYRSSATFAEAQAALLLELFADEGLLVLDANTRALKSFATALFEKELRTAPELSNRIQETSKSLAGNYHAQIDAAGANLFLVEGGRRNKLKIEDGGFVTGDKSISLDSLLEILRAEPERFSMNVVLRPLVQDTLLPTAAYVAGPGEIAYFAQLSAAYAWAGIQMPVVVPRISLTLVEERFEKLALKYQTSVEALLELGPELVRELLKSEREDEIASQFEQTIESIEANLEQVRNLTESVDGSLGPALTTLKGKTLTQLKDFASKVTASERKKQQTAKQQFDKALNVLLPESKLQERELNPVYFLNKYGLSFWNSLKAYVLRSDLSLKEHHLVAVADILKPEETQN